MKKLLLVAGATAVVVGGGVATANHYDQYQNKKQATQQVAVSRAAEAAKRSQYNADQAVQRLLQKQLTKLQAECQKGLAAYAKLTPFGKTTVQAPVCSESSSTQQ